MGTNRGGNRGDETGECDGDRTGEGGDGEGRNGFGIVEYIEESVVDWDEGFWEPEK